MSDQENNVDVDIRPGDTPFDDEALEKFKALLLKEKAAVNRRMGNHVDKATKDQEQLPDELDQASRHSEQAYLLRIADKERKLLKRIEWALDKIKNKTYGICEGSGEDIDERRLELRPWTRYCIAYKEELEMEERNKGKTRPK